MLGTLVSFAAMRVIHPETVAGDTWGGMTTVAGSWIGGGANQAAMREVFDVHATMSGQFVAVDVLVGNLWTAVLLFLAIGLGATGLCHFLSQLLVGWITSLPAEWRLQDYSLASGFFWIVVIATTIGLLLSFTRARTFEGAGASRIGSVML
jgi:hypothetical protein